MQYPGIFIIIFTALRLLVALINFTGRQWLKRTTAGKEKGLVSVLIPARNEEDNIGQLLEDLTKHDYHNIEVLVYDDLSEDKTRQIAESYAAKDNRIKVIYGDELPEGWLGKNHACHKLSIKSKGKYLLFTDADVRIDKGIIKDSLAYLKKHNLALLSIFPVQIMYSFAEKITVPFFNWILISLLPLVLTRTSARPSLSAANGQFMLFAAGIYHKEKPHSKFRHKKAEDIAIAKHMKLRKHKIQVLLGNSDIRCRMYKSWHDSVQGLSKNIFEYFGGSVVVALLFGLITTFGFLPVVLAMNTASIIIYFSMVATIRIVTSAAARQNVLFNLFLAPLQQINFMVLLIIAVKLKYSQKLTWKGRIIK